MSNPAGQTNHVLWALSRYRYVPLLLVACIGIGLSVLLFGFVRGWEQRKVKTDFQRAGEIWVSDLTRAFDHHLLELEAIGAFYAGSQEVTRSEFCTFVKPFLAWCRDIQALEWIPRVPAAQRAAYEEICLLRTRFYHV